MKTAQQVLEAKGFDNDQINDIINFKTKYSEEGFDMEVRKEFGLENEPLHLWEAYFQGDADYQVLSARAKERGYILDNSNENVITNIDGDGDVGALLVSMDHRLIELCENIEKYSHDEKIEILVTLQNGHPDEINPLLNEFQSTQSRFSDYVDEFCSHEEAGRFASDLSEEEIREVAERYINDNWQ